MRTNFTFIATVLLTLMTTFAFGQNKITGTIVDGNGEPLPDVSVTVESTGKTVSTDLNGNYSTEASDGDQVLFVEFLGLESKKQKVNVDGDTVVGNIILTDGGAIEEVVFIGKGIVDIAKDRETPVAVSTIKADVIHEKLGNQEFPEILKTTPSVYATKQGGGYGDSRINIRGFDQRNTAVMINGQPINDMENGQVYWSNWSGLQDIATAVQIQRGLGASSLAVPSVGGTINVVTKSTEKEEGGIVSLGVGNDWYHKTTAGYNTGINNDGWAASFLLSRWQGNGWAEGTKGEGYTYFASVGYKPNDTHAFNLVFTGAGQWHDQRRTNITINQFLESGRNDFRKYNRDWGHLNGREYSLRRNFYNKPIGSFNWDWNINDRLSLATVLYGSWGRGGGTGSRGGGKITRREDGTINFDAIVANNQSGTAYTGSIRNYEGKTIGSRGYSDDGVNSDAIIRRAGINSHDWYGAISNLKYEADRLTLGLGVDLRSYKGYHYTVVNDLLGLDAYYSVGNANDNGRIVGTTIKAKPFNNLEEAEKINYHNIGKVQWAGLNGVAEYKTEVISTVVQLGVSNQHYQRIDYFKEPAVSAESDKENIMGGYVKGGINYNINENHNIFGNAGFVSRQPLFDAVFPNFGNNVAETENEEITSFELGYGYRSNIFNANVNLYRTTWGNRFISRGISLEGPGGEELQYTANFAGIEQLHQGVEVDFIVKPLHKLEVNGMFSYGDWKYTSNVTSNLFDDNQQPVGTTSTLYLEGVKVGDVAQLTASLGLNYEVIDGLSFDTTWNYADNLYSDFAPDDDEFLKEDNQGALELPNYHLFDVGMTLKKEVLQDKKLIFRVNVNNVLDTEYIAEGNTNIHSGSSSDDATGRTYQGIDTGNQV
ncbi:MAG: TonB-dependent receptor, partial [Flavobacteriales bacterium]